MSTKYKATMPDTAYFITITTVGWVEVFTRLRHKNLLVDSLVYCQNEKGLEIYAYCIMTNHIHLMCKAVEGFIVSNIMRDFNKFTLKKIANAIMAYPESRRVWMLDIFKKACSHLKRDQKYKVWQNGYHAEVARSN